MALAQLLPGDPARVGRYRLTARLGAGGMGVVYLGAAKDGGLVAVKVLRPELAENPEFRARFSREVTTLTRVKGMCTVLVIEAAQSPQLADSPFRISPRKSSSSVGGAMAKAMKAQISRPHPDWATSFATGPGGLLGAAPLTERRIEI